MKRGLLAAALLLGFPCADLCAQRVWRSTVLAVSQPFSAPASDKDDKPRGISGVACAKPLIDGTRECVVANDEETFLEIVMLSDDVVRPTGRTVSLTGPPGAGIGGTARVANCPTPDDSRGLGKPDTEGLALDGGFVYAAGSHSCSGGGRYRPASFLLSRYRVGNAFSAAGGGAVQQSWRLADALLASGVASAYGKKKDDGTNIEGIAVADGVLYAGLRTPTLDGQAVIVSAPVAELFAPGSAPLDSNSVTTVHFPLGVGSGIRDLAALPGGGLLILSGPTHSQPEVPYRLWRADRARLSAPPIFLATVEPTPDHTGARPKGRGYGGDVPKAEAVAVLDQTADRLTVLVMYDNVDEGWPTRMTIDLPKR